MVYRLFLLKRFACKALPMQPDSGIIIPNCNENVIGPPKEKPGPQRRALMHGQQKTDAVRLAYIILAHTDPAHIVRLCRKLAAGADVFVHI